MTVYDLNRDQLAQLKQQYLIERSSTFTDDGQEVDAVIPAYYADKFDDFVVERKSI